MPCTDYRNTVSVSINVKLFPGVVNGRHIATEAVKPGAGIAVLRDAVGRVMDARTDLAHIAA